jgi:serine/threonine-protein phosphatase 6 regulatory ankyrin repeat subunit B
VKDNDGYTPLMFAVVDSRTEMVKALLDKDVDVNAKSKAGNTALTIATSKKLSNIVELLRKANAIE